MESEQYLTVKGICFKKKKCNCRVAMGLKLRAFETLLTPLSRLRKRGWSSEAMTG